MGPPHLTLNIPCLFALVFSFFSLLYLLCVFCFVLVGWVMFVVLVAACEQKMLFSLQFCVLGVYCCFRAHFPILFSDLVFRCVFGFLILEVRMCFLCCLFVKRNTIDSLLVLGFCFSSSWHFCLVLIFVGLSFPIKIQTPKPWNSEEQIKQKCNINPENHFFSQRNCAQKIVCQKTHGVVPKNAHVALKALYK